MSTSVAGYTLLRKLGAGGQGEVWLARDDVREEDIALKLVSVPGGRSDPVWLALEQEYGTSRLLDHPGVLKVEQPVRDGDTAILPMEFAEGGDLRGLRGSSYLEIVPVLIEIAQALEYAHEHSIVHRDLKPGNVLRDKDQRVLLSDFGLSGGVSPFTASPQQLEGAPPAVSDDIYGLGALAYELLSGYPPYHPNFDLRRAIEGPVPPLKPVHPVPAPLVKLILQMLSRAPKHRPRTMRQVIDAFDAALNDTLTFDQRPAAPKSALPMSAAAAIAANLTMPTPELLRHRPADEDSRDMRPTRAPPRPAGVAPREPVQRPATPRPAAAPRPVPTPRPVAAPSPAAGARPEVVSRPETAARPAMAPRPLAPTRLATAPPLAQAREAAPHRRAPARAPVSPAPAPPTPVPHIFVTPPQPAVPPPIAPTPWPPTAPVSAMYAEPKFPAIEPVLWSEIRAEHTPTLMRIEPVRTSRWVSVFVVIALLASTWAWFNWPTIQRIFNDSQPVAALVGESAAPPADHTLAAPQHSALEGTTRTARVRFEESLATLNAHAAGVWGGAEFASAQARAAEGSAALASGDYGLASARYKEAMGLLDIVSRRAPSALAAQLANGDRALQSGQGDIARQSYELARRIDPRSKRAEDGLKRSRGLSGVLPLLADGANAEAARNFPRAVQDYSQALALDPANEKAKTGLARANAAFGEDSYAKAVGSGFAALGAGRLEESRVAFENARALRPDGREAAEGLGRVGAALRARGFASARARAASYEVEERWSDALQEYQQALQIDSTLSFAQEGRARAVAREELADRIDGMIDHPERLGDPGVRAEATSLLNQAHVADPSGPMLRSQAARLDALVSFYDRPVRLSLVSDNATQVAIQRVGSFGSFARREVELKPGRYTVVGTRAGFRDVRRDVTVAPGQDQQSISVSCIEPI